MNNQAAILLFIVGASGCGSVPTETSGSSGAGGSPASSSATTSASSTGPSSSSSGAGGTAVDAGPDATPDGPPPEDAQPVCRTCAEALAGPDHVGAEQGLCLGTMATSDWFAFVNCGCANGGSCEVVCSGTLWCKDVYPTSSGAWHDPAGACATCLSTPGALGCGDQAATCSKH